MIYINIKLKENKTRKFNQSNHWVLYITVFSFILSAILSFAVNEIFGAINVIIASLVVLIIILIGVLSDTVGIAVAAADETQFHAMASKRIKGSKTTLWLIRNANQVASVLNDVVGDICGVISGGAVTLIVVILNTKFPGVESKLLSVTFSAFVASLTIGGKALGKTVALKHSNSIVYHTALFVVFLKKEKWEKNKKNNGKKNT